MEPWILGGEAMKDITEPIQKKMIIDQILGNSIKLIL